MQLLVLGCTRPDFQARSDRSWTGSATTTWSGSSTRWACARGVDGEVEVLHNSQLGADQQAAFGALVGGLIGWAPPGRRTRSSGRARPPSAGGRRAAGLGVHQPPRLGRDRAGRGRSAGLRRRRRVVSPALNPKGDMSSARTVSKGRPPHRHGSHRSPSSRQRRWPADAWGADGTPGAAAASNTPPGTIEETGRGA